MPRIRLELEASASEDWLAAISSEHPDATFRILASHLTADGLLGIAEITTPAQDRVIQRFENASEVRSYEVIHSEKNIVLIQYIIPKPASYDALRESGNLPRFPATMQGGWLHTEMTASHERLSQFVTELAAVEVPYHVSSLTQSAAPNDSLTDRQWEFITTAVERGYYENPRECTLTELAELFAVNKSAASGVLRRAERQIISEFVEASAGQ